MKKKLSALVLLAALVLSMVSCNGEEETTAATTTAAPAATTTQAEQTPDDSDNVTTEEEDDYDDPTSYTDLFIPHGSATIDGVVDDAWANAASVQLQAIKTGTPAEDTAVKASAMWNENGIYFLFEITDTDRFQLGNAGDFNNDSLYLYIAESVDIFQTDMNSFNSGVYQFALINKINEMLPRKGLASELADVQSAYTETDNGYIIEFSYKPTIYPLAAGNFLLIDYQYNDASITGSRVGALGWYNGTDNNGDTSLWAYAKLLAEGEASPVQE